MLCNEGTCKNCILSSGIWHETSFEYTIRCMNTKGMVLGPCWKYFLSNSNFKINPNPIPSFSYQFLPLIKWKFTCYLCTNERNPHSISKIIILHEWTNLSIWHLYDVFLKKAKWKHERKPKIMFTEIHH